MEPSELVPDLLKLKKLKLWDDLLDLIKTHRVPLANNLLAACAKSHDPVVRAAFAAYMADGVIMRRLKDIEQSVPKEKKKSRSKPKEEYPQYPNPLDVDSTLFALGDYDG